ncbi:alpha/beta hydrolase [Haloechinothrix sp. LS1_15]|uniref:alpha/beta hydrolase n=1 Tax=Haloechinothrix sp. LS1_15 TaxID=2652248 RepID=UPI002947552C|nr:alpha/beta hydrolase [Haloechinothrix sp. LS1_15]MDV6011119.1 alpha/beta hydrolase [Haloechinothrix sp. LS1_15]
MVTQAETTDTTVPIPETPSPQSAQLVDIYRRQVRPRVDLWRPHGIRLHALRTLTDLVGLARLDRTATTWTARHGTIGGTWLRATDAHAANGVVLHLHGGGFVFGSHRSHRVLAHELSRASRMPVFLPHYRRAPRYPFPAAADDALTAYRELLDRGIAPERIRVVGDSAGGHLAACLLADLARSDLPMPAAAALYSPLLDLSCTRLHELDEKHTDPFISPLTTRRVCEAYLQGTDSSDPRVDVLGADKRDWPPTLIQVGDTECLRVDAERMLESLRAANIPCELQVWPGQIHVFQGWANLPEARAANDYTGRFLRAHGADQVTTHPTGANAR